MGAKFVITTSVI